jgi:cytochrome c
MAGILAASLIGLIGGTAMAAGDAEKGKRLYRACVACHSLEPGRHMTGPSLAGIWGHRAGKIAGFNRYSDPLKSSTIVWNAETLDAWLKNPRAMIPGNRMTFRGIANRQVREDLLAYLQTAARQGGPRRAAARNMADLKSIGPARQVKIIRHCGDTYRVTTAAGETIPFWEFNLRFKTDGGELGPPKGRPALLRASMQGDRAFVVFASPDEISAFIAAKC